MKNVSLSMPRRTAAAAAVAVAAVVVCFTANAVVRPPKNAEPAAVSPRVFPDYSGVTVPCNVAPLNMAIEEDAERVVVVVSGEKEGKLTLRGPVVRFPVRKWRKLLERNAGADLAVDVYARRDRKWSALETFRIHVSEDPIDGFVSYRSIEPGYDYGNRLTLIQRELTSYREHVFFDNRGTSACVNCHSFQNRKTDKYLFHFRAGQTDANSGTIVSMDGKVRKISGKIEELGGGCSYPAWRPAGDLIAFSSNKTFQTFHTLSTQKIEVFDITSDLVVVDAAKNSVRVLTKTPDDFETFPNWAADGNALYYCSAHVALETPKNDLKNSKALEASQRTREFHYDIMKMDYDEKTDSFSNPVVVVDAAAAGKSALFPRESPDGRFLVYTVAESGTFPIWRPEADLWIKDLTTGEERPLDELNARGADSYHTWDSSGRWLVFSSRREDGQYTRLYFAHFDPDGNASKPFVMPQMDPLNNLRRFKSYNVPEFTSEPIHDSLRTLNSAAKRPPEPTASVGNAG